MAATTSRLVLPASVTIVSGPRCGAIAAMIAEAESLFGGVDVLINNAGIQHVAPVDAFPPDAVAELETANAHLNLRALAHELMEIRR